MLGLSPPNPQTQPDQLSGVYLHISQGVSGFLTEIRELVKLYLQFQDLRARAEEKAYDRATLWEQIKENDAVIQDREKRKRMPDQDMIRKLEKKNDKLWNKLHPVEKALGEVESEMIILDQKAMNLTETIELKAEKIEAGEDLSSFDIPIAESTTSSSLIDSAPNTPASEEMSSFKSRSDHTVEGLPTFVGTMSEINLMETSAEIIGVPDFENIRIGGHKEDGVYLKSSSLDVLLANTDTQFVQSSNPSNIHTFHDDIQAILDSHLEKRNALISEFGHIPLQAEQEQDMPLSDPEVLSDFKDISMTDSEILKKDDSKDLSTSNILESSSLASLPIEMEASPIAESESNQSITLPEPLEQNEVAPVEDVSMPDGSSVESIYGGSDPPDKSSFHSEQEQSEEAITPIQTKHEQEKIVTSKKNIQGHDFLITSFFSSSNRVNRWMLHQIMSSARERSLYYSFLPSDFDAVSLQLSDTISDDFLKTWDTDDAALSAVFRANPVSEVTAITIFVPKQ